MNALFLIALSLFSSGYVPADSSWAPVLEELEALEHRPLDPNKADSTSLSHVPLLTNLDVAVLLRCRRERPLQNFADLRRRLGLALPVARLLRPVFVFSDFKSSPSALVTAMVEERPRRRFRSRLIGRAPESGIRGVLGGVGEGQRVQIAGGGLYRSRSGAFEIVAGTLKGHLSTGLLLDERGGFSAHLEMPRTFHRFYPSTDTTRRLGCSASCVTSSWTLYGGLLLPRGEDPWTAMVRVERDRLGLNAVVEPSLGGLSLDGRFGGDASVLRGELAVTERDLLIRSDLSARSKRVSARIAVQGGRCLSSSAGDGVQWAAELNVTPLSDIRVIAKEDLRASQRADGVVMRRGQREVRVEFDPRGGLALALTLRERTPFLYWGCDSPKRRKRIHRLDLTLRPLPELELSIRSEQVSVDRSLGRLTYVQGACSGISIRFCVYDCPDYETSISTYEPDVPLAGRFVRLRGQGRRVSLSLKKEFKGLCLHLKTAFDTGWEERLALRTALAFQT
jgi:hypothetical protein